MRGLWIAAFILGGPLALGCHPAPAPAPAPPRGPTACARAADSMVAALLANPALQEAPPTETADRLRNLIRDRCERDAWSADATGCLIAMKRPADAEPCAALLTEAQQAQLVRDEQALFAPPAGGSAAPREDR